MPTKIATVSEAAEQPCPATANALRGNLPPACVYRVGGSVRDQLLGRVCHDHDYVVVGLSADELLRRGFQAVGRDFPVFLHPITHEEYALARTERKQGHGYHGFVFYAAPDVTLEEDLARRDLTINAIAQSLEDCRLIDPYGGAADLAAGVLRHVSEAFAEDPVRILRLARFAARLPRFRVAPDTLLLVRQMVAAGEVDHLVAERVWQEMSRALMEEAPAAALRLLQDNGVWQRLLPEVGVLNEAALASLTQTASDHAPLSVRFAVLAVHALMTYSGVEQQRRLKIWCERWRVPAPCHDLAALVLKQRVLWLRLQQEQSTAAGAELAVSDTAALWADFFRAGDALRRRERFDELLDVLGRVYVTPSAAPDFAARLSRALAAWCAVDAAAVVAACGSAKFDGGVTPNVGQLVHEKRCQAIAAALALPP